MKAIKPIHGQNKNRFKGSAYALGAMLVVGVVGIAVTVVRKA